MSGLIEVIVPLAILFVLVAPLAWIEARRP